MHFHKPPWFLSTKLGTREDLRLTECTARLKIFSMLRAFHSLAVIQEIPACIIRICIVNNFCVAQM